MKKIIIGSTIIAALLTGAGVVHWQSKPSMDKNYISNLRGIVQSTSYSNQRDTISKIRGWQIDIETLEGVPREEWNAKHIQPQVMFNYGSDSTIYTMNLDGSDVRLLLNRGDVGELPVGGNTQRTANGRYVAFNYSSFGSRYCMVYDLKDREILAKMDACHSGTFNLDSSKYYYLNFQDGNPYFLDLKTKKNKHIFEGELQVNGEIWNPSKDGVAFIIDQLNGRFIYSVAKRDDSGERGKVKQLVFSFPAMTFINQERYVADQCQQGYTRGPIYSYIVCGDQKPYELFSFQTPNDKLEDSPERYPLQRGKWYARAYGNRLVRLKQPEEIGMFDGLSYYYALKIGSGEFDYKKLNRINFYIPADIYEDFENMDLRLFMPPIPTKAQFDELLPDVTEELRRHCARSRAGFMSCAQFYDMKVLFTDMDQVREYMGVKKW
ncbi:hypothetical protein BCT35_24805 [Vibrio lentus]|uniref:WD40 repeat domain-containing protein n=1 Tax=Vibrio lentus TaxID=136468 RepID=UPI000C83DE25|nr:WD40 repeat domain-containing protein [Vibrio lentus]PMI36405.1 hypothetical protein BCU45_24890 [Vibrio lentus]PMI62373.1 hypothetical protein BCU40_25060 [Vibrio lentus]PMJ53292.1 hypothetical protein BCU20_24125 [Vibrio lentus]PML45364.1 hypothetical protein BCT75_24745 [Vibrio lentus]PMM96810.1 hypothetical protein BCT42_24270 [Vibrio lentus]